MIRSILILYCLFMSLKSFSFAEGDSVQNSSVILCNFNATLAKKIVHFKWNVRAEKKNGYFIIEKSIDKKEWRKLTRIESIGTHEEQHTYSISEINFAEGPEEFFRISWIGENGNIEVLDIVEINQPILQNMLLIPIKGKANKQMLLSYDSMIISRGKITILDEGGEIVLLKTVQQIDGYNREILNIRNLKSGTYHVLVRDEFNNTLSRNLTVYRKRK